MKTPAKRSFAIKSFFLVLFLFKEKARPLPFVPHVLTKQPPGGWCQKDTLGDKLFIT